MMLSESYKKMTKKEDFLLIFICTGGLISNLFPIFLSHKNIDLSEELQAQDSQIYLFYIIVLVFFILAFSLRFVLFRKAGIIKFSEKNVSSEAILKRIKDNKILEELKKFSPIELKLATLSSWLFLRTSICFACNTLVTISGVALVMQTHSRRYIIPIVVIVFLLNLSLILLPRNARKRAEKILLDPKIGTF